MPEKEEATVNRLANLLSQMTEKQRDVFLARGEGYRDGYHEAMRDMQATAKASPG